MNYVGEFKIYYLLFLINKCQIYIKIINKIKSMNRISFFVLVLCLSLFSFNVMAQSQEEVLVDGLPADAVVTEIEMVEIANVNFNDIFIKEQSGNKFTIVFDIYNGQGVQPDMRYGIKLINKTSSKSNPNSSFVDEKVYDEIFSMESESSLKEEFVYEAPEGLKGVYHLYFSIKNSNGLSLALMDLGEVSFTGGKNNIKLNLDDSKCYVNVVGEEKKYILSEGVDINPSENIELVCFVKNKSANNVDASVNFEVRNRSTFGDKVKVKEEQQVFNFAGGGEKEIKIKIPVVQKPQAYSVNVSFLDEEKNAVSNVLNVHYVVAGESASIINVIFDKNEYKKGDKIMGKISLSQSADSFAGSRLGGTQTKGLKYNLDIENDKNISCIESVQNKSIDNEANEIVIDSKAVVDCTNPNASIVIMDADGNVLDSQSYKMFYDKSLEMTENKKTGFTDLKNNTGWIVGGIILFLILIVTIIMLIKNRKGSVLGLLMLMLFSGLFSFHKVEAITLSADKATFTVSINSTSYAPKGDIKVCGKGVITSCWNEMYAGASANGTDFLYTHVKDGDGGGKTFEWPIDYNCKTIKAAKTCGNHCVDIDVVFWHLTSSGWNKYTDSKEICYTIPDSYCEVKVNGQCNSVYNGQVVDSKPTSGLCTAGTTSGVSGAGLLTNPWKWSCSGSGGGSTASCSATQTPSDGQCNSEYNGQTVDSKPTSGLCENGTASVISGEGSLTNPWKWSCDGINGGVLENCSARRACGTAAKTFTEQYVVPSEWSSPVEGYFCPAGTVATPTNPEFPQAGSTTIWQCDGSDGSSDSCLATNDAIVPTCPAWDGTVMTRETLEGKTDEQLCGPNGKLKEGTSFVSNDIYWNWSCVLNMDPLPAGVNADDVFAECKAENCLANTTFNEELYVYFKEDGTVDPAKFFIESDCPDLCCVYKNDSSGEEVKVGTCDGEDLKEGEIVVDGHPDEIIKKCTGGPEDECDDYDCPDGDDCPEDCKDSIDCDDYDCPSGDDCPDSCKSLEESLTIQCVCTANRCTAQGSCAATPVFASSIADANCSSECSSDSDCGDGGVVTEKN